MFVWLLGRVRGAGFGLGLIWACLACWVAQVVRDIDMEEPDSQTPAERQQQSATWHKDARGVFTEAGPSKKVTKYRAKATASAFFRFDSLGACWRLASVLSRVWPEVE